MESGQQPPQQQPEPGWYPNPQGPGLRVWDGTKWTDQTRIQRPAPGWYPDPQRPGLRYWDGTKWTDQYQAPSARGRGFFRGRLLVTLGVLLGGTLLVGGCVAIIGIGADEAQKERNRKGINQSEFDSIQQGMSQQEVEQRLGPPKDSQEFEQNIPELQDQPFRSSCIYYPEKNQPLFEGQSFQFCFDEGKLTSKNAY
jgi:hypothetical protein